MEEIFTIIGFLIGLYAFGMLIYYLVRATLERKKDTGNEMVFIKRISKSGIVFVIAIAVGIAGAIVGNFGPEKAEKEAARKEYLEQGERKNAEQIKELEERKNRETNFAKTLESEWNGYGEIIVDPEKDVFYLVPNSTLIVEHLVYATQEPPNLEYWNTHLSLAQDFYFDVNMGLESEGRDYRIEILSPMNNDLTLIRVKNALISYDHRIASLKEK